MTWRPLPHEIFPPPRDLSGREKKLREKPGDISLPRDDVAPPPPRDISAPPARSFRSLPEMFLDFFRRKHATHGGGAI